jgi:type II secretory pathway pseudopilin PulG
MGLFVAARCAGNRRHAVRRRQPASGCAALNVPASNSPKSATHSRRGGHTLLELITALVCSSVLLAGLGSVMLIARQVAYTPSAAVRRTATARVASQLADELQYATLLIGNTPNIIEFVVADRDGDGTSEKIRYEWSGTSGDPLVRTINGGTPKNVLEGIEEFQAAYVLKPETTTFTSTSDTAETILLSNDNVQVGVERDITMSNYSAQLVNSAALNAVPANAICWNITKVQFQGRDNGSADETLLVQFRSAGGAFDGPTSEVLGQVSIPESTLGSMGWKQAKFANTVRGLALHRKYALVWAGLGGDAARLQCNDSAATGVFESNDASATWQFMTTRQMYYRIHGTYTVPGMTHDLVRNYVSHVQLALQSGEQSHARVDTSVPLVNLPEMLSSYWRTDFDRDPTDSDVNGDGALDWAMAGGASFDSATLIGGVWHAFGALETRPLCDFTQTTIVEARCRSTSVGGNGAVVRLSADRQSGLYAPLMVRLQLQTDGTQTLSLLGQTSDSDTVTLFTCRRLSSDFVNYRLTIVPQHNIVNLYINDEDQGTVTYPVYAPSSLDRFLTLFADASLAEFDYVDVRVSAN